MAHFDVVEAELVEIYFYPHPADTRSENQPTDFEHDADVPLPPAVLQMIKNELVQKCQRCNRPLVHYPGLGLFCMACDGVGK